MIDLLGTITALEGCRTPSSAEGAWGREARLVIAAAGARGVTLREDDLIYFDVHDLQALRWRYEHSRDHDHDGHHSHGSRAA